MRANSEMLQIKKNLFALSGVAKLAATRGEPSVLAFTISRQSDWFPYYKYMKNRSLSSARNDNPMGTSLALTPAGISLRGQWVLTQE